MKNFIFTFIFVSVCISTNAQWKQSDADASGMHNTVVRRKAIDTANLRIKYAWGATDITQDSTYLDCGQLLIGQRMTKYSSWFVEVADSERVQWAKMNPHAQSVPNGTWWMRGKKPGIWSEYQYSTSSSMATRSTNGQLCRWDRNGHSDTRRNGVDRNGRCKKTPHRFSVINARKPSAAGEDATT